MQMVLQQIERSISLNQCCLRKCESVKFQETVNDVLFSYMRYFDYQIKLNPLSMGNTLNEVDYQSWITQINKEYDEVKQDPRGIVLLHKETQNNYILKEYTFCNKLLFELKTKELQEQINKGPRQYVISPIRIQSKIFSSFCSNSYKIYAIFEFPQVTLHQEINARQKENKHFQQTELWSILQSCTNALSELKPLVSLNPHQIFINPDGHLKIIHDDLVDQNYRAVLNDQIYYAPQKIRNFNKIDSDLTLRKQSIFSMGMTLLESALLSSIDSCYDYLHCKFQETNMMYLLDSLTSKYSPEFVELLSNIIQTNPNRRASLMEVQKLLDNYWGSQESQFAESGEQIQEQPFPGKEQQIFNPPKIEILKEKSINSCKQVVKQQNKKLSSKRSEANFQTVKQKQIQKERIQGRRSVKPIERQITIPDQVNSYKLQKPKINNDLGQSLTTPKNQPSSKQNNLYTDPKLLQMIKKDLQDIGKLKQSAFYQTSKYTYMYPQTQSILNSIKNFQTDPKIHSTQVQIGSFSTTQHVPNHKIQQVKSNIQPYSSQIQSNKTMMKKNNTELIFSIETYQNGRKYEGTTLHGKKHGKGKLMFEDGAYYEGEFIDDKMNGKGVLYYSKNVPAYDGQWYNDQFQGYGILYNESPQQLNSEFDFRDMNEVEDYWLKYEGQFALDNKSGRGKLYLTNGQTLDGQFKQDFVNGQGRYCCISGQVYEGIWVDNVLTQLNQVQ